MLLFSYYLVFKLVFRNLVNDSITTRIERLVKTQQIDKAHAEYFGRLLVQDLDGRIKPINTLASEFVRKISRKSSFSYPYKWQEH